MLVRISFGLMTKMVSRMVKGKPEQYIGSHLLLSVTNLGIVYH